MNRLFIGLLLCIVIASCGAARGTSIKCYRNTKTMVSASWMGKMTDHYFKLKKKNYFQYYERFIGLTKLNEYSGTYTIVNDTIQLFFCGDKIPGDLTGMGFVDNAKKQIVLFANNSIYDQQFFIHVDKR